MDMKVSLYLVPVIDSYFKWLDDLILENQIFVRTMIHTKRVVIVGHVQKQF